MPLFDELELAVSHPRMERYRPQNGSDFATVANYFWNMALCEALYPSLNVLEITLRNGVHQAASRVHNSEFWFDQPGVLTFQQPGQIRDARRRLTGRGRPLTAGRIIAELSFGFWTTLLSDPYHSSFWMPRRARMLKDTFPHMTNAIRIRGDIHRRYDILRYLRNRVFHFEPIWDGVPVPFQQAVSMHHVADLHNEVIETIGWISPTMRESVRILDHFDDTYHTSKARIEAELRRKFGL